MQKDDHNQQISIAELSRLIGISTTAIERNIKYLKEKEIIIKEVVMVSCSYCGGLMPQTSVLCPNCGARRKS